MEASSDWRLIVTTGVTLGYAFYRWRKTSNEQKANHEIVCCSNKDCVRCQRYRQVQKSAQSRYPWIAKNVQKEYPDQSLERAQRSIQSPVIATSRVQAPTVLMLHNLPSQPVVTSMHENVHKRFKDVRIPSRILQEAQNTPDDMWLTNDSPNGTWKVLSFLNQGCWVFDVCKKCPETFQFIESLPNLLDDCLFGNAMISKISPGTLIEPHCGPTNIRHRLQMALKIPSSRCAISLRVSDLRLEWGKEGDYFIFDDSFVHSVSFSRQEGAHETTEEERIVLIVDLWHPEVSPVERCVLQNVYPPASYWEWTSLRKNLSRRHLIFLYRCEKRLWGGLTRWS